MFSWAVGFLEMVRRCIWNFLRVEVEHIKNYSKGKATAEMEYPLKVDLNKVK